MTKTEATLKEAGARKTQSGKFVDQYEAWNGSHLVMITHDKEVGGFNYRLYVNNGQTATLNHGKSKTVIGAARFCKKVL